MPIGIIIGAATLGLSIILVFKYPSLSLWPIFFGQIFAFMGTLVLGIEGGGIYTMLGFLLSGVLVFSVGHGRKVLKFSRQEIMMFLLGILMLVSLTYTASPDYGKLKILRFFGWAAPLMVGVRIFTSTREQTKRTLSILSLFAAITMLFYAFLYLTMREAFTERERFGGLTMAWACAICIALSMYPIFGRSFWRKVLTILSCFCGLFVMAASGGRGAFFGILVAGALSFFSRRGLIRSVIVLLVLVAFAYFARTYLVSEAMKERLTVPLLSGVEGREAGRIVRWKVAFGQFVDDPIVGGGIGSFSYRFQGEDIPDWPHNTWLEVAGEQGIIGLACLATALGFSITTMLRLRKERGPLLSVSKTLQMIFWVGVLNSLSSFDLHHQSALLASFGFMAGIRRWLDTDREASMIALDTVEHTAEYPDWERAGRTVVRDWTTMTRS